MGHVGRALGLLGCAALLAACSAESGDARERGAGAGGVAGNTMATGGATAMGFLM